MGHFLIVRAYDTSDLLWPLLVRRKRNTVAEVSQVLGKYVGLEGVVLQETTEPPAAAAAHRGYRSEVPWPATGPGRRGSSILLLGSGEGSSLSRELADSYEFCGYDYGTYRDAHNHFSSVFNEVIFGVVPELVEFTVRLNERLLFSHARDADAYTELHKRLFLEGRDVEDPKGMDRFAVFSRRERD